ncbi:MAG TPA: hypothetical protein VNO86_06045 [Candidatus Binatia bacterium]|nr:hypothetical protein [Candidatus Binatia bacterium]
MVAVGLVLAACGPPGGFVSGADIDREAEQARAVVPLPPGFTYPPPSTHDPGGAYQPGTGRSEVEFQAMCAWFRYWAEATAKDDQAGVARATAMVDQIRTWSAYRNFDQASRDHLESMIERARLGDASGLIRLCE